MSDSQNSGFGQFVPGFDFLQGLAKGASHNMPQMPPLANWVAPTLDPEELEKRITELKAVQFWLDQNATALKATLQALEVQKMTLATLKGMNFDMGAKTTARTSRAKPAQGGAGAMTPAVDPMQLWGALAQQFQHIAAGAMQEVSKQAAAASSNAPDSGSPRAGGTRAAAKKVAKKTAARRR